jgi:hypothetical protein
MFVAGCFSWRWQGSHGYYRLFHAQRTISADEQQTVHRFTIQKAFVSIQLVSNNLANQRLTYATCPPIPLGAELLNKNFDCWLGWPLAEPKLLIVVHDATERKPNASTDSVGSSSV